MWKMLVSLALLLLLLLLLSALSADCFVVCRITVVADGGSAAEVGPANAAQCRVVHRASRTMQRQVQ
jgi:hypothetical protein